MWLIIIYLLRRNAVQINKADFRRISETAQSPLSSMSKNDLPVHYTLRQSRHRADDGNVFLSVCLFVCPSVRYLSRIGSKLENKNYRKSNSYSYFT